MVVSDDQLYKILLENEYLSEKQLKAVKESAEQENESIYNVIIEKDLISDENLGKIVADYLNFPFVNLSRIPVSEEALKVIPESVARKQKIIAYEQTAQSLKLATSNPQNLQLIKFIEKKAYLPVQVSYATDKDIMESMRFYKKQLQTKFDEIIKKELDLTGKAQTHDLPVTKMIDLLIEYAYDSKASDIHIEPRRNDSITRFRIDGVMHNVLVAPKSLHNQMITRIKILAKLPTDEHLKAQDGKMQVKLEEEELDVRVSIVPIVEGENAVLRLLSSHSRQFSLTDLGLSDNDLEKVRIAYQKPYGMLLVTGPTGSGKTTSIYSVLKILNTKEKNIDTIEDPVEYEIQGINQIQVNLQTNLTFADGLRSILRQDPDIIFVGEIRDKDTASIAINSAMTGHLVLSTLHTNDAATAIPRLIDMDIEPFLVSSTINIVIAQRLVRKICDTCRVSYTQTATNLKKNFTATLIKKHFGDKEEIRLYKGKGCPICHNTGYIGRTGIYEVLEITKPIQTLINKKADADVIHEKAVELGMNTMLEDGMDKVQQGITTFEEILRVTKE